MTGVIRKFACIGLLAALAACGTAPDNSQKLLDANAAYFAQDFACTRAGAVPVDFVELAMHSEKYADACVRTNAFTDAAYLYTGAGEMQPKRKAPNVHPVLGTYWKSGDLEHRLHVGPSFVTAVGRVRRCADYLRLKQDGDALRAKLGQLPPATILPPSPCRNATMGLFISEAQIIPTAMD